MKVLETFLKLEQQTFAHDQLEANRHGTCTMSIFDESEALRQIPLFRVLDAQKLRLLTFSSKLIRYSAGETIIKQGDVGESVYVTIEGNIEISIADEDGAVRTKEMGQNTFFGELAILRRTVRSATVTALTDLLVLQISQNVLLGLIEAEPDFNKALSQHIKNAGYD